MVCSVYLFFKHLSAYRGKIKIQEELLLRLY